MESVGYFQEPNDAERKDVARRIISRINKCMYGREETELTHVRHKESELTHVRTQRTRIDATALSFPHGLMLMTVGKNAKANISQGCSSHVRMTKR